MTTKLLRKYDTRQHCDQCGYRRVSRWYYRLQCYLCPACRRQLQGTEVAS